MNKHLEFINGQWCVVDHDTGERTGSKKDVGRQPNQEVEPEEMFGSQVYIESFTLNTDERPVYPYKVIFPLGLRCINFTPITILYGSNGSGKSTVLNVIANSIGITRKTEGSTNAYFASYLEKCSYQSAAPVLPIDDSSFVRSEDIMDGIMKGRKRYSSAKKLAGNSVEKMPEKPGGSTMAMVGNLLSNPDGLTSDDRFFLSRCDEARYLESINSIADTFESNGEVALSRMKEIIMPDSICLLDEPEISLSPVYQRELASMIELFAGKLRTQFIIATHSPFFLSLKDATIYDLDSHPAKVSRWQDLPNMHAYFKLFEQNREQFIEHSNGKDKQ